MENTAVPSNLCYFDTRNPHGIIDGLTEKEIKDEVIVSARTSSFSLSKKQIIKIKKLCLN